MTEIILLSGAQMAGISPFFAPHGDQPAVEEGGGPATSEAV
jgi:hypothetical protein